MVDHLEEEDSHRIVSGAGPAGVAALFAGILWLSVWAHQMATHGRTQENEMEISLGLTWMDSGKFLVLAFLLLIPGILLVGKRALGSGAEATQRKATIVASILCLAALGTALEFWFFEWGSYTETFESKGGITTVGITLQAFFSALLLPITLIAFGIAAARQSAMPYWLVAVLVIGSLATVFTTPVFIVPGLAWLVFGLWLLTRGRQRPIEPRTSVMEV